MIAAFDTLADYGIVIIGFSIPPGCKDRLYWIEREGAGFVPFTKEAEQLLLSGKAHL